MAESNTPLSEKDARLYATLCHLLGLSGIFVPVLGHVAGPLILWLLKRKQSAFVDEQGKEAVNFQITVAIVALAAWAISVPLRALPFPSFSLQSLVEIVNLVFVIIAAVEVNKGVSYKYPFSLRLVG